MFAGEIHRRCGRRILWHQSRGLQSQRRPWRGNRDNRFVQCPPSPKACVEWTRGATAGDVFRHDGIYEGMIEMQLVLQCRKNTLRLIFTEGIQEITRETGSIQGSVALLQVFPPFLLMLCLWRQNLTIMKIDHEPKQRNVYVVANVQIQLMYTLAGRVANVYISWYVSANVYISWKSANVL